MKIVCLHQADGLQMPLAHGATLQVTPFRESPRVALTIVGPGGGDFGGVILNAERARLLGSWLLKLAGETGQDSARPVRPRTARPARAR